MNKNTRKIMNTITTLTSVNSIPPFSFRNLKALREMAKLSQKKLAQLINIPRSTYADWERSGDYLISSVYSPAFVLSQLETVLRPYLEWHAMIDIPKPEKDTLWKHKSGNNYMVILVTSEPSLEKYNKFPIHVVYQSVVDGQVWTRPLSQWHRSFKQVKRPISLQERNYSTENKS